MPYRRGSRLHTIRPGMHRRPGKGCNSAAPAAARAARKLATAQQGEHSRSDGSSGSSGGGSGGSSGEVIDLTLPDDGE